MLTAPRKISVRLKPFQTLRMLRPRLKTAAISVYMMMCADWSNSRQPSWCCQMLTTESATISAAGTSAGQA